MTEGSRTNDLAHTWYLNDRQIVLPGIFQNLLLMVIQVLFINGSAYVGADGHKKKSFRHRFRKPDRHSLVDRLLSGKIPSLCRQIAGNV